jgi:hypothetical protein
LLEPLEAPLPVEPEDEALPVELEEEDLPVDPEEDLTPLEDARPVLPADPVAVEPEAPVLADAEAVEPLPLEPAEPVEALAEAEALEVTDEVTVEAEPVAVVVDPETEALMDAEVLAEPFEPLLPEAVAALLLEWVPVEADEEAVEPVADLPPQPTTVKAMPTATNEPRRRRTRRSLRHESQNVPKTFWTRDRSPRPSLR